MMAIMQFMVINTEKINLIRKVEKKIPTYKTYQSSENEKKTHKLF